MIASAHLRDEILQMKRRRQLYSAAILILLTAIMVGGYGQANEMNSGGFISGLAKFFDYPGEIVAEAWTRVPRFPACSGASCPH